jgi:hypothetical protein
MNHNNTIESRIQGNKHFAGHLRTRLLATASPAARDILNGLTDSQLIEVYLANERQGREHSAKQRAEKGRIRENSRMQRIVEVYLANERQAEKGKIE